MNKKILLTVILTITCELGFAAELKNAPAVIEAVKTIEEMGCKPWLGVMRPARIGLSEQDDNAFAVPMFCNEMPQSIVVAQKSGKVFVSKDLFKIIAVIKFDGKKISVMAKKNGNKEIFRYEIEAFK